MEKKKLSFSIFLVLPFWREKQSLRAKRRSEALCQTKGALKLGDALYILCVNAGGTQGVVTTRLSVEVCVCGSVVS